MRTWAHALIDLHLDPSWSFAFDNARTRAGLCNYTAKRISVSRHMALRSDDDEVHQVLLHEVGVVDRAPRLGRRRCLAESRQVEQVHAVLVLEQCRDAAEAFAADTGLVRVGQVGNAVAYLLPARPLVEYATEWFSSHR